MDCSMPGFPVHHQLLELTKSGDWFWEMLLSEMPRKLPHLSLWPEASSQPLEPPNPTFPRFSTHPFCYSYLSLSWLSISVLSQETVQNKHISSAKCMWTPLSHSLYQTLSNFLHFKSSEIVTTQHMCWFLSVWNINFIFLHKLRKKYSNKTNKN